jgi:hypothetical protein
MGVQYSALADGYPLLVINHKLSSWSNEAEADQINRVLIEGYSRSHPEWREVFGGLAARASRADSNGLWGTVFLRDGGYLPAPTSPQQN